MELPTKTPTPVQSTPPSSSFASEIACRAATNPNCDERLMRLDSLLSKYWLSSYPHTRAPIFNGRFEKMLFSNELTPQEPANNLFQNSLRLQPNGLATPIPVT